MKTLKRLMLLALVMVFTNSLFAGIIPELKQEKEKEWTVLVYLGADNNLSSAGYMNILEMSRSGSNDNLNIVCMFDEEQTKNSYYIKVNKSEANKTIDPKNWNPYQDPALDIQVINEVNSGAPETLYDFVDMAFNKFPAKNYFLVFWNHGSGFYTVGDAAAAEHGSTGGHGKLKRSLTKNVNKKFSRFSSVRKKIHKRSIAYDDAAGGDSLTQLELKAVFQELQKKYNKSLQLPLGPTIRFKKPLFSIIGFDACLMNNYEVVYQLRNFTPSVIGSEESEPGAGWDYEGFLNPIIENPSISVDELSEKLITTYIKKHSKGLKNKMRFLLQPMPLTLSHAKTEPFRINKLTKLLNEFSKLYVEKLSSSDKYEAFEVLSKVQAASQKFSYTFYIDLYDMMKNVKKYEKDPNIKKLASKIMKALKPSYLSQIFGKKNGSVIAHHGQKKGKDSHGLSIFFPDTTVSKTAVELYKELDFSKSTKWAEMVEKFMVMIPKIDLGNIDIRSKNGQVFSKFEILNNSNFPAGDLKVELVQFQMSKIARKIMKDDRISINFEENPVKVNVSSKDMQTATFILNIEEKVMNWFKEHRAELDKQTYQIEIKKDNGFLLYKIGCRYSTLFGIRADLTAKHIINVVGKIHGQVVQILDKTPKEKQKEVMFAILDQLTKMFNDEFYIKIVDQKNRVSALSLDAFLEYYQIASSESDSIKKILAKKMAFDLVARLETALKTSDDLPSSLMVKIKDALYVLRGKN